MYLATWKGNQWTWTAITIIMCVCEQQDALATAVMKKLPPTASREAFVLETEKVVFSWFNIRCLNLKNFCDLRLGFILELNSNFYTLNSIRLCRTLCFINF
jgi:hypothetical protein